MIIANSTAMRACVDLVDRLAMDDGPVAIVGPERSGRERLARRLHEKSRRGSKSFASVDVGQVADAREAWEEAERRARGGTVALRGGEAIGGDLLDGIGRDMRHAVVRVVLVLENAEAPLVAELPDAAVVHAPTLAERRDDVPELALALVHEAAEGLGVEPPELEPEAFEALEHAVAAGLGYRELAWSLRRAVTLTQGRRAVGLRDLPGAVQAAARAAPRSTASLADASRAAIEAALGASRSRAEAAASLGITSRQLRRRCRALGLPPGKRVTSR